MVDYSGNPTNARLHKVKQWGILLRKSWESLPDLNFSSASPPMPLTSFLFLSIALFALRSFFSSFESAARSSDSYSWTKCQPSLFLSAIFISVWRFLTSCFPSATNLRTSHGFSKLPAIWVKMLFKCEFNSNCFLFPLNLIVEAYFPILGTSSNCLPFSSNWEVEYPLKSENTWFSHWEFGNEWRNVSGKQEREDAIILCYAVRVVVCKNRAEVLKIKKKLKFFSRTEVWMALVTAKYQKCRKKNFCIICILNMKETSFDVWYDIRGNSSVLVMFFLEVTS